MIPSPTPTSVPLPAAYSADYLIILREQLDAAGFNSTKISAPDSNWGIAGDMLKNQTLMDAVDVIGGA